MSSSTQFSSLYVCLNKDIIHWNLVLYYNFLFLFETSNKMPLFVIEVQKQIVIILCLNKQKPLCNCVLQKFYTEQCTDLRLISGCTSAFASSLNYLNKISYESI